jgi:cell division protein FtsB
VKRSTLVRLVGRIGVVSVAVAFLSIVGIQYARVIGRNVALAHELRDAQSDLVRLKARRAQQAREIRRLSDPRGAIPEIHAKLHLVGDNEAIIYLKRAGSSP